MRNYFRVFICAGVVLASIEGGDSFASSASYSGLSHSGLKTIRSVSGSSGNLGSRCSKNDKDHICLAIKYVVYRDGNGQSLVSENDVVDDVSGINDLWNQCNIGFQVDEYDEVMPENFSLNLDPSNLDELPQIRSIFDDDKTLLVVTTGEWNRYGSLGSSAANAWTAMPGDFPFGVILEQSVGTFANIIAHELGHYLNLFHEQSSANLMNPIIYPESTVLSSDQCEVSRTAALSSWQKMLR